MATPFSTDSQHYYSTGAVLGIGTGPVFVTITVLMLNDSTGEVLDASTDLQHYYSTGAVLGTSNVPVLVAITVPILNDSTGEVLTKYGGSTGAVLAECRRYAGAVLGTSTNLQHFIAVLAQC